MSLVATVVDPLVQPVPSGWDKFVHYERLVPGWDPGLVRAVDWCARHTSSMALVTERGSGEPVAAFHARHVAPVHPHRFTRPGRIPLTSLTVCVTPQPVGETGVAFAQGTDASDRAEAVRTFERAVRRRAGRMASLGFGYQGLYDHQLPAVRRRGRIGFRLSPRMVITNEWPDGDSYLRSLRHKWRYHLRKIRQTIDRDGLRVELVPQVDPQQACWLAERVRRRYAGRALPPPPLPLTYFTRLVALPESRFLTYHDGRGRLVAYTALYDDGHDLVTICWGSRKGSDGGRANLYFDQYRRLVEEMVAHGRERLLLGRGWEQIKRRYGARPEQRWGLVSPW